jgi:hypothetical protein
MNNGLSKNNKPTFEWNEVRVGITSPGPDWVLGGTTNLYFKNIKSIYQITSWVTRTSNFGGRNIDSIAFGNNLWVAGGLGGTLRTSTANLPTAIETTTQSVLSLNFWKAS